MMIKFILFSCFTLTLINISLASESNEQLINGDESNNHVQQLRLRFKRSAGKSLLSSFGSTSTGSNAPGVTSDGSGNKGLLSGFKGFGNSDSLEQLTPEKLAEMTFGQLETILGEDKGSAGLKKIIEFLKGFVSTISKTDPADFMKGDLSSTKALGKLLSSTNSGSNSGITDIINNFVNRGSTDSAAGVQSSTGSQGRQ